MKLSRHPYGAFSLVEVTLALGIMAFCLVAIFGLLPTGLNSDQAAIQQTAAAGIATALAVDLRQTPAAAGGAAVATSPRFLLSVPVVAPNQTFTHTLFLTEDGAVADANPATSAEDKKADPAQNPRYRATLIYSRKDAVNATDRTATMVRLLVSWPAVADPTGGALPVKFSGAFETMIALDRN